MYWTFYNSKNRHGCRIPVLRNNILGGKPCSFWFYKPTTYHKWIKYCQMAPAVCEQPKMCLWLRLKGTLAWDFCVPVFCTEQTYIGQIIILLSVFDVVLEFADLFEFFNIWRWLSWRRVSLPVNWVNAEWDSTSTESTRNETPGQLREPGMMKASGVLGPW
jgi:hypothetical protein